MHKINTLIFHITRLLFAWLATPALAGDYEYGLKFALYGDYNNAASYYKKAAEQGQVEAQAALALMYEEGRGVPQGYKQAATWYLKAAEQDNVKAQSRLGKLLAEGRGVKQDRVEAYKWFMIAKEGHKKSPQTNIADVASQMTQSQIAEAQRRKSKWLKLHTVKTQPSTRIDRAKLK